MQSHMMHDNNFVHSKVASFGTGAKFWCLENPSEQEDLHMDLKSESIFPCANGTQKLYDFGGYTTLEDDDQGLSCYILT